MGLGPAGQLALRSLSLSLSLSLSCILALLSAACFVVATVAAVVAAANAVVAAVAAVVAAAVFSFFALGMSSRAGCRERGRPWDRTGEQAWLHGTWPKAANAMGAGLGGRPSQLEPR